MTESSSNNNFNILSQPPSAFSPPSPQYTKLPDAQIQHGGKYYISDASGFLSNSLITIIQALTTGIFRSTVSASATTSLNDEYDPKTRSWSGENGLRYKVPLMTVPGSGHCRVKQRNIQVLLQNVRELCVNDQLPATKEEKQFWASYRFLRYQLFMLPFMGSMTVTYMMARAAFNHLPMYLRGRSLPIVFSLLFAEQAQEAAFPAEELLKTAMASRTPLGDAARAEWLRLQPVSIHQSIWVKYKFSLWMRDCLEGFEFGGDIVSALK
jgi:hypothetical protein